MKILALELWRSWREERASAGLLAAGLALIAAAIAMLPFWIDRGDPLYPQVMTVAGASLAALTLTEGLAGRGHRAERFALLARLPIGTGSAFVARLVVFLAGLAFFALLGRSLAVLGAGILDGEWGFFPLTSTERWIAGIALVVASFGFALAAWVPQSALALPAGAFVASLILAPLVALFFFPEILLVRPTPERVLGGLSLGWLAATVAAWRSFTHASRPERCTLRSVAWSGAFVIFAVAPLWVWGLVRSYRVLNIDPLDPEFRIVTACLEEDARHAILEARVQPVDGLRDLAGNTAVGESFALRVDLDTGGWSSPRVSKLKGLPPWPREAPSYIDACPASSDESVLPQLEGSCSLQLEEYRGGKKYSRIIRGVDLGSDIGAETFSSSEPFVTQVLGWAGCGLSLYYDKHTAYFDPFRRLFRTRSELLSQLDTEEWLGVWIRPTNWFVRFHPSQRALLFDPSVCAWSDPRGLESEDDRLGIVSDGRLLILRRGVLLLVDPDTAVSTHLSFTDGWTDPITDANSANYRVGERIDAVDPPVLWLSGSRWHGLARLDLATYSLARAQGTQGWFEKLLGCPDRDHGILLEDDHWITRVRFGSDERVVLFPRATKQEPQDLK